MKKGEVYFWFSKYNSANKAYMVAEINEDAKQYILVDTSAIEPTFLDFWKIGFKYYERNIDMFKKIETMDEYDDWCEKRDSAFPESVINDFDD